MCSLEGPDVRVASAGGPVESLEADDNSSGRLCKVGEFVEIQLIELKVGNLIQKAPILCTKSDIVRDSKIRAASVYKGATSLLIGSRHDELVCGIEEHSTSASQDIRLDVAVSAVRQINDQGAERFMKVRLNRRRSTSGHVVLRVTGVPIIPFGSDPFVELIGIAHQEAARLRCVV